MTNKLTNTDKISWYEKQIEVIEHLKNENAIVLGQIANMRMGSVRVMEKIINEEVILIKENIRFDERIKKLNFDIERIKEESDNNG